MERNWLQIFNFYELGNLYYLYFASLWLENCIDSLEYFSDDMARNLSRAELTVM